MFAATAATSVPGQTGKSGRAIGMSALPSFSEVDADIGEVCFTPGNGRRKAGLSGPKSADFVAKIGRCRWAVGQFI